MARSSSVDLMWRSSSVIVVKGMLNAPWMWPYRCFEPSCSSPASVPS
jgi:hypothetical protein